MEVIPFLLIAGAIGAAVWFGLNSVKERRRQWRYAAEKLGLSLVQGGWLSSDEIVGQADGFDVRLDTFTRGSGKNSQTYTRIVVEGGGLPHNLELRGEGLGSTLTKFFQGEDIQIDDARFDEDLLIKGDEALAVALLGDEARRLTSHLIEQGGLVRDGQVYYEERGTMGDAREITQWLRYLRQLAGELTMRDRRIEGLLSRNAMTDNNPAVRRRNLALLMREYPRHEVTQKAAHAALTDPHPVVSLQASIFLGDEGLGRVLDLVADARTPQSARTHALSYLGSRTPTAEVLAVLLQVADDQDLVVAGKAIEQLGKVRHRACLGTLLRRAGQTKNAVFLTRIADGLGVFADTQAQQPLLVMLVHDETMVRVAAARALGTCGTVAAVEPLLKHTRGFFTDGDLKRAAQQAIAQIQSGLSDAASGGLSLTEPDKDAGALTVTEDPGALSLTDTETA